MSGSARMTRSSRSRMAKLNYRVERSTCVLLKRWRRLHNATQRETPADSHPWEHAKDARDRPGSATINHRYHAKTRGKRFVSSRVSWKSIFRCDAFFIALEIAIS